MDHDQTETTSSPPPPPDPTRHLSHGEHPGDVVGPYKLKEIIGEGGFGTVWVAEQKEPIARRVAIKIIKPGMDSKEVIARFEQERQALALMDHPNIARVHDAGTTPAGGPYFAMEFVRGAPITDYCDKARLTIAQRLELFSSVCDGVQHAHMKGIIHRDLKPSNILVAAPDAASARQGADHASLPTVKIIDFGVAKALASKLTEKTIFTERGQLIGTPEYMSPEQAEMAETDIDTRTDVYALGVILYELLAGALPFDPKTLRSAGYGAIQKMIREVDPPRPSTKFSSLGVEGSKKIADARRMGIGELTSDLRGELEWIPLKAMRKERSERYRTASKLGDDLDNYLQHRPLIAGPESTPYKVKKFVRRNRVGVAAGVVVLAALILGLAGTVWQARAAAYERDIARAAEIEQANQRRQAETAQRAEAEQRRLADQQRDRAEAINEFVTKSLQSSDPNQQGAQGMTVADAMTQALANLDRGDLKGQPSTVAGLLRTIAHILDGNGRSAEAEAPAERALAIERVLHPGDHQDVSNSMNLLALVRRSMGRTAEAEPMFVQALEMQQRLFKGDHPDVATSLNNLAYVRSLLGRAAEAEPMYVEALAMFQRLRKGDHPDVARQLNSLASVRESLGRAAEAEPLYVQGLEMRQRLFKGDHPDVATSLNNLASVRYSLGRAAEAEPLFAQVLEMNQRLFQGNHPDVARSLNNLAAVRQVLGRASEAEPLYVRALEMRQRLFQGDHPDVALNLNTLAGVRQSLGRAAEAEPLFVQSLEMFQRLFPGDHPSVARSLNNLANSLHSLGRAAEAEPLFVQALDMEHRLFKGDHPEVAASLRMLARCLATLDRLPEALARAQESDDMAVRILPEGHPLRRKCDDTLAEIKNMIADKAGGAAAPK